ncbi:MAG: hypothetical protein DRR42_27270 [Gammaproteobacteria bacterium]|nr:MAG: hypothetical protein DRR42_27270 [Gammaproteobacteria bacterium]
MTSARKAIVFSFIDRYLGLFVTIATSIVLARLLTPKEIGVFSVTVVLLGIVSSIRDMGAGQYIVREPNLTEDGIRATRTLQLGIGVGLAVLAIAFANPVAKFYNEPEIEPIMWVLACNFIVTPLGAVMVALWTRKLKFEKIALMRLFGAFVGAIVGISLALRGFGSISLAWSALATQLSGVILANYMWKGEISLLPGLRELKRVFGFGSKVSLYSIISSITTGTPEMILGRLQGMTQTGFLSRGQGLVAMFDRLVMDAIGAVIFPIFSKTLREGGDLGAAFVKCLGLITAIGWCFFSVLAITAFPVMRILYGDQWDNAIELTQILSLAAAIGIAIRLTASILIINGSMALTLKLAVVSAVLTIIGSLVGCSYGLEGLGWALVVVNVVNTVMWLSAAYMELQYSVTELASLTLKNITLAVASSLSFMSVYIFAGFEGGLGDLRYLVPCGIISVALFTITAKGMNHPIYAEIDTVINTCTGFLRGLPGPSNK